MKSRGIKKLTIWGIVVIMALQWFPMGVMGSRSSKEKSNIYVNTFDDANSLQDFTAYYGKNAKEGLSAASFDVDWTVDGTLSRLNKPHGIGGFWQSNANMDGTLEYGYVAELVYTGRQYTNFELTVDAMQVTESISRQFGIGFGKTTLGAFFVGTDNQVNAAGGVYAGVAKGGLTSLWGYLPGTVNASIGAMKNDGRVYGKNVTGGSNCGTWHTVKVRVEDGKVSMWIKPQGAADSSYEAVLQNVALLDYDGGYISLMTNANAAFDNLSIVNLDPQAAAVKMPTAIAVAQGTPADQIPFPKTVCVTDCYGLIHRVPVSFTSDNYDAKTLGTYTFTGELNVSGMALQNGYGLKTEISVSVKTEGELANMVTFGFNDIDEFDDFASYYAENAKEGLAETDFAEDWYVDDGTSTERVLQQYQDFDVTWYNPGKILSVEKAETVLTLNLQIHERDVAFYLAFPQLGGIRMYTDMTGIWEPESLLPITYEQTDDVLTASAGSGERIMLTGVSGEWLLQIQNGSGEVVFSLNRQQIAFGYDEEDQLGKVRLIGNVASEESLFGLGERFNSVVQNGNTVGMWNYDCYDALVSETGDKTQGYKNIPLLHSTAGYSIFFSSSYYCLADIADSRSDAYCLDFSGPIFDFYIWAGEPLENIESYTDLTGKSYIPAKWAFSFLAGQGQQYWQQNGTDQASYLDVLENYLKGFQELGTPISGLYGELGVVTERQAYKLMENYGTKTIAWQNSEMTREMMRQLLPELESEKYPTINRVSNPLILQNGNNYVDFTNPVVVELYEAYLADRISWGLRGEMVDFGDNVYEDSLFYNGMTGSQMHNLYPYYYTKAINQAFTNALGSDEHFLFSRAAAPGSQSYAALFAGDHPVTFAGLKQSILGGLNISASGYSVWGSDIGGLAPVEQPSADLYMRWMQFGTFSPLMRTHGFTTRAPWDYGDQAVETYQTHYWLRENLLDFIYGKALVSGMKGTPMMKSMALMYPNDPELAALEDQYIFCDEFLVAPVTEENTYTRTVVFPEGKWVDFWTGQVIQGGGALTVAAPQERCPVYIRQGAMIPVTVSADLQLMQSMLDVETVQAMVATCTDETRTLHHYADENTCNRYCSGKNTDGTYYFSVDDNEDTPVLIVYGLMAQSVTANGKNLTRLGAMPLNAEGYYVDAANNRTVIRCEGWENVNICAAEKSVIVADEAQQKAVRQSKMVTQKANMRSAEKAEGTLARLKAPHEIEGFWQSNVDGTGEYGYLAELVYTKRQYTNFELTVDAMQVGESISRQFGIGFGKTELGAFFTDSSGNMNTAGGAYVGVERGGGVSLWGYAAATVSTAGTMKNSGRVYGTSVSGGSECGTWHTVKVRVENSKVSMWVKPQGAEDSAYQQVLTNVALKNYTGGYISLMTNANAAFDNLTLVNLDPAVVDIASVGDISVSLGTALAEIPFPKTVAITDENGSVHQVPVSFTCSIYNSQLSGRYSFTGKLDVSSMVLQNKNNLTAEVFVEVMDSYKESFDTAGLTDFTFYYAKNAKEGLTETPISEDWTVNGTIARLAKPHGIGGFWQSNANLDGTVEYGYVAELVYTGRQYTDFELTVDAMQVAESISRQFAVGFGKTELGAFFVNSKNQMNTKGGAYVGVERGGKTNLWGYAVNTVNNATGVQANNARVQGTVINSPSGKWHTVKVRVENSAVSMWVKDLGADDSAYVKVLSEVALKDYQGGYISLMTNANAAFDNLEIIDLGTQKAVYKVTYVADGKTVAEVAVRAGESVASIPAVPEKVGFTGVWDHNGNNITEDTVITAVYSEAAVIEKWNISLRDDIGVNFYVRIKEEQVENTVVSITVDDTTNIVNASQVTPENGYYVFRANVAAAQMTENVNIKIVCGDMVVQKNYSVYEYAQYILEDVNSEFDEKTEKLVREMLNYGAAAQNYFNYNTDKLIDAKWITGAGAAQIDASKVSAIEASGAINGVHFYGASLVFRSKTAVRFYFVGDISKYTVSHGVVEMAANGLYYVEIGEIEPQSLDDTVTLTVTSSEESVTVAYSPMNYMVRMGEKGSEDLQLLLKALYNYHIAAAAYAG